MQNEVLFKSIIDEEIDAFSNSIIKKLEGIELKELLQRKNPYLIKAKNTNTAEDYVLEIIRATISSSEEEKMGMCLEDIARKIAEHVHNAKKSDHEGMDLEWEKDNKIYLMNIKSGLSWGNSSQWRSLTDSFLKAKEQNKLHTECYLGACYGTQKSTIRRDFINIICGRNFWRFISKENNFYKFLLDNIRKDSQSKNRYKIEVENVEKKLINEFKKNYCIKGKINWEKIIELNSENIVLD